MCDTPVTLEPRYNGNGGAVLLYTKTGKWDMRRITISLRADEGEALRTLAEQERRDPRAQAALLIRYGLEHLGLLQTHSRDCYGDINDRPDEQGDDSETRNGR